MANSYAFVLSKNTYPDAFQANLIGVDQGTRIVYSATNTLTSESVLYADSRLTQPIYGNPDLWLGVQLLTDDAVKYPIEISTSGSINIGTTTTTAAPTTTTTTAAALTLYASTVSGSNACTQSGPIYTLTSATVSGGTTICNASSVTSPSISGLSLGIYYVSNGFDYMEAYKDSEGTTMLILNACTSC